MGKLRRVQNKPMEYLRAWRETLGLSRQQVANKIGTEIGRPALDQGTIAKWESGETAVRVEDLTLLAEAYGVTPDRLFFSPNDREMPARMKRAFEILSKGEPDTVEKWLSIGEAFTNDTKNG